MKKLLLCVFILSSCYSCKSDKYNLSLNYTNYNDFKWTLQGEVIGIDSTSKDIKNPLYVHKKGVRLGFVDPLSLLFYQVFDVPEKIDLVDVAINNKCSNLEEVYLKVFCLDSEDNVIQSKILDINNDSCWTTNTLSLSTPLNTTKILVGIYALGAISIKKQELQELWLDYINILLDNKSIETYPTKKIEKGKIKQEYLSPLNVSGNLPYVLDSLFATKKIIGLGESMHGSQTITEMQVFLLKQLITKHNCKLVLLERDIYESILLNLFVQDLIPEDAVGELQEMLYNKTLINSYSPDVIWDFTLWLREYNKTTENKVGLIGVLELDHNIVTSSIFDYLYPFIDKENKESIISILNIANIKQVLERAKELKNLEIIMGKKEYSNLLYVLNSIAGIKRNDAVANFHKQQSRDSIMWHNTQRFISMYTKGDEKIAIVAHEGHIGRKSIYTNFPHLNSLGYYINKEYKNAYYPMGIYAGTGEITSFTLNDTCFRNINIGIPANNSLEEICSRMNEKNFFYPSKYLAEEISSRMIGVGYIKNHFIKRNLRARIDGIIFLKETRGYDSIKTSTYKDISKINYELIKQRSALMKKIY